MKSEHFCSLHRGHGGFRRFPLPSRTRHSLSLSLPPLIHYTLFAKHDGQFGSDTNGNPLILYLIVCPHPPSLGSWKNSEKGSECISYGQGARSFLSRLIFEANTHLSLPISRRTEAIEHPLAKNCSATHAPRLAAVSSRSPLKPVAPRCSLDFAPSISATPRASASFELVLSSRHLYGFRDIGRNDEEMAWDKILTFRVRRLPLQINKAEATQLIQEIAGADNANVTVESLAVDLALSHTTRSKTATVTIVPLPPCLEGEDELSFKASYAGSECIIIFDRRFLGFTVLSNVDPSEHVLEYVFLLDTKRCFQSAPEARPLLRRANK